MVETVALVANAVLPALPLNQRVRVFLRCSLQVYGKRNGARCDRVVTRSGKRQAEQGVSVLHLIITD